MSYDIFLLALTAITLFSSLLTEAIKKVLDEENKKYSANILVIIISSIVSVLYGVGYIVYNQVNITPQLIIEILILCIMSFLCATLGYDKVIQSISQIRKI